MDEDRFNIDLRKFFKEVGVTSQREIDRVACEGQVQDESLELRMTLAAENTPLEHIIGRRSRSVRTQVPQAKNRYAD